MNAPRTLRELLLEASGHGELSTRQLEAKVRTAAEKGQLQAKLNRATIAQILNGSYRKRPTDDTIRAIAYLAGVDDEVAFTAAGRRTPGRPFAEDLPDGVDDLTPKEREAAVYMLRVLVQQRRELNHHEDQGTQDPPSDPPADGETRTSGAPMKPELPAGLPEPYRYEYDQITGGIREGLTKMEGKQLRLSSDDLHALAREEYDRYCRDEPFQYLTRHAQAVRAADYFDKIRRGFSGYRSLAAVLGLPFGTHRSDAGAEVHELHAARDLDGMSDGERRRLPGKDAGEENQDPGDDWGGA